MTHFSQSSANGVVPMTVTLFTSKNLTLSAAAELVDVFVIGNDGVAQTQSFDASALDVVCDFVQQVRK